MTTVTQSRKPTSQRASGSDLLALADWPDERPDVKPFMHGWFYGQSTLPRFCGPDTKLIVELGSWLGVSARWFAHRCPQAKIVCVDHWQGSPEFNGQWDWLLSPFGDSGYSKAFAHFCDNMWEYRDQIVPLRMDSVAGVELLASHGVRPDLVYVDAGHHEDNVAADVAACEAAFPDSQIVGDDWDWGSVQRGVNMSIQRPFSGEGRFWWTM